MHTTKNTLTCDNCHYTAVKKAKNDGWSVMTSFSPTLGVAVYRNICPTCSAKLAVPERTLIHTKGNVPLSHFMKED